MAKICGIYKITSPTGKVYIGQSTDIEYRWRCYRCLKKNRQPKLLNSLKKHGPRKHKFEIIIQCEKSQLNELERYYQDLYCAIGKGGMNCILTEASDRPRYFSEETKKKISKSNTGKKRSKETIKKLIESHLGQRPTEQHKKKMADFHRGRKRSAETCRKISEGNKGKKMPESMRYKMTINNGMANIVLNTENGIFYESTVLAAKSMGLNAISLCQKLSGRRTNKTSFIKA